MLANHIIKQLRKYPKGIGTYSLLEKICYHRADHQWTNEQHREIKKLLQMNPQNPGSYNYDFNCINFKRFETPVSLSGTQFLLDDFPSEMKEMWEANACFEQKKANLMERVGREELTEKEKKLEEHYNFWFSDFFLCIDKTKFPAHHTWWNHFSQRHLFDKIVDCLEFRNNEDPFQNSSGPFPEHLLECVVFTTNKTGFRNWNFHRTLERICLHRLAYTWTADEHNTIKELLRRNRTILEEHTRAELAMERGLSCYEPKEQKILSGLQFLLDDFPQEMQFLKGEKANLEEGRKRFEQLANEKKLYTDEDLMIDEEPMNLCEVLSLATKPPHHTWWNTRLDLFRAKEVDDVDDVEDDGDQ